MLLIKNGGHIGFISLLVYDASKLSTVYVVKSPVLGLQRAFLQKRFKFSQKWKKFKKIEMINKIIQKQNLGGCHHLLLVYDASKFSIVYVCSKITNSRPSEGTWKFSIDSICSSSPWSNLIYSLD